MAEESQHTQIKFLSNQTALQSGKYKLKVTQSVNISSQKDVKYTSETTFVIAGERFSLNPQDVHSVFPPLGNSGDYSNCFPHIVLKRSTLPWERSPGGDRNTPWLALLLFHEEELQGKPKELPPVLPTQVISLQELRNRVDHQVLFLETIRKNATDKLPPIFESLSESELKSQSVKINFPGCQLEAWEKNESDRVIVLDVQKKLLASILPKQEDLKYLAHVRQYSDGEQLAVVIGDRVPKKGGVSTVYLVSLENRYQDGDFNYQNAKIQDYIRFVVLKSWSFACLSPDRDLGGLLHNLDPGTLRLPNNSQSEAEPNNSQSEAEKYLAAGYLPLPHFLRQGSKTISWYRTPLTTGENRSDRKAIEQVFQDVSVADNLICYDSNSGLFDVSYAAAWQLGKLIALQDKQFALELYRWKREEALQLAKSSQEKLHSHLPIQSQASVNPKTDNTSIQKLLEELSLLRGVPFNYLVPDERMLPPESIRFFCLDWFWIRCLQAGALSIGKQLGSEVHKKFDNIGILDSKQITGFLLQSEVVSGWPDLQIFAYNNATIPSQKLTFLRKELLSENVLFCLFEGEIRSVEISLKPEAIHFGLYKNDHQKEFIDIKKFLESLELKSLTPSSAQFALQTIQKAEKLLIKLTH